MRKRYGCSPVMAALADIRKLNDKLGSEHKPEIETDGLGVRITAWCIKCREPVVLRFKELSDTQIPIAKAMAKRFICNRHQEPDGELGL